MIQFIRNVIRLRSDLRHAQELIRLKDETIAELTAARDEANADYFALTEWLKKQRA